MHVMNTPLGFVKVPNQCGSDQATRSASSHAENRHTKAFQRMRTGRESAPLCSRICSSVHSKRPINYHGVMGTPAG